MITYSSKYNFYVHRHVNHIVLNFLKKSPQKLKLETLRATRDQSAVSSALTALTRAAESGEGNLLQLSIEASRVRCTVGEISDALEKVHGRHVAVPRMVSGAYVSEYGHAEEVDKAMKRVEVCVWRV